MSIAGQRTVTGKPVNGRATTRPIRERPTQRGASESHHAGLALEQVDALTRQQQRILRRSVVIDCALKAEALDPPTMREAVAALLADITEAARHDGNDLAAASVKISRRKQIPTRLNRQIRRLRGSKSGTPRRTYATSVQIN